MGLSIFNKTHIIKALGLLYVLFTAWLAIPGIYYDPANVLWTVIILGFGFVIPHARRFMAKKTLEEKTGLDVVYLRPAYHLHKGKGYLAINEESVLFIRKGDIYQFPISEVTYMEWGNHGTGEFITDHGEHSSRTYEKTLPIFSIEGEEFAYRWVLRFTNDTKRFKKLMEKYGDFKTDSQRYKL